MEVSSPFGSTSIIESVPIIHFDEDHTIASVIGKVTTPVHENSLRRLRATYRANDGAVVSNRARSSRSTNK